MKDSVAYRLAELERRLWNLLRLGTIAEADYAVARVRVQSGDLLTGWIPWLTRRASSDIDWWAPELDEQVLLLSPCGDPAQAVAMPALYQSAYPAPEQSPDKQRIVFKDGTAVSYDRAAKILTIECAGDISISTAGKCDVECQGTITVESSQSINVQAPTISVTGNVSVEGNISASGSVTDAAGNTNHHSHP